MGKRSLLRHRAVMGVTALLVTAPVVTHADGPTIDKVYHPYVNALEREIEFRSTWTQDDDPAIDGNQVYHLGLGRTFGDRVFAEVYLIGTNEPTGSLDRSAFELELKWQLTEQGEFFADWGLLFELESLRSEDVMEFSATALVEKELGPWTGTVNLSGAFEWGDDINDELESQLSAQLRYRYSPKFEPALEFYSGQQAKGLGPVALGQIRFAAGRKLLWQLGVILGLDSESPDQTYRAMLEFEF